MFASSAAIALMRGHPADDAVAEAVADATVYVLDGAAATPRIAARPKGGYGIRRALGTAQRIRARSGVVVATGGCFDLLHAGHLATLEAARRLGDCLIVLINSDRSVASLKGEGRPVVGEQDRAQLLEGLECVDAVAIFDDRTPVRALEALRPDVFAKGGDYRDADLPEAAVMRQWAGQTVILPTIRGHSTTALIERVSAAGTAA
jgi:rfaE bifunctional protein nucleotidyltransferase chain/domain